MVVHNLYIFRTNSRPAKAHPELVVYSNAVLSGAIPFEFFKAIARRDTKILKPPRDL
jgi:hypothetical protein